MPSNFNCRWAPPGTSSDPCAGLNAYLSARPFPSPLYTQLSLALFVLFLVSAALSFLGWYALRRMPRLRTQPLAAMVWTTLGCGFLFAAIGLKHYWVDEETGHAKMSCNVFAWLYVSIVPIVSATSWIRLYLVLHRTRYERHVRHYMTNLMEDNVALAEQDLAPDAMSATQWLRSLMSVTLTSDASEPDVQTPKHHERLVQELSTATSNRAIVVLMIALYLPVLAAMGVLFTQSDVHIGNCPGCDLFLEHLIVIIILVVFTSLVSFRVQYLLYKRGREYDTNQVAVEMLATMLLSFPFVALGLALLATDPSSLDYDGLVSWEWLLLVGVFLLWIVWCPYQVCLAFLEWRSIRSARSVRRVGSFQARVHNVEESLKDPDIRVKFEDFAERNFIAENLRFLEDTRMFLEFFDERSNAWRATKSALLCKTYIRQNSPLQINVSSKVRAVLERRVRDGDISVGLFDEARNEVLDLIRDGHWAKFVQQQGGSLQSSRTLHSQVSHSARFPATASLAVAPGSPKL
jgi:hypothetical protein